MSTFTLLRRRATRLLLVTLASTALPIAALAQDLEPRRWSHLPVGMNVAGVAYAYTDGDLSFDPVLQIEDGNVENHTGAATYARAFDCFGKTGRLDVIVPYQKSRWHGLLEGEPAARKRDGFGDPWLRLSVDLVLSAVAVGFPVGNSQAVKLGYLSTDTQNDVGSDADTFFVAWNVRF